MKRRNLLKLIPLSGLVPFSFFKPGKQNLELDDCHTTADIEGPFYLPDAPVTMQLADEGSAGTPLFITGTVYANDCITPLKEALVDVWHASDDGGYEDVNYRGRIWTDASGNFAFQTILPGKYLNGAQFRPRHLHYKVSLLDVELTTQIYFEGDTSIPIDPWASDPSAVERIIPLTTDVNDNLHGVTDIFLGIDPIVSTTPTVEKIAASYIKSIFPNPIHLAGNIEIFVKEQGNIRLELLDVHGHLIKVLMQEEKSPGKFTFSFTPSNRNGLKLQNGVYILRLFQDGIPLAAKRLVVI